MEKCARCRVKEDSVQLHDVIYEGSVNLLCERCAIIENISIIRKPDKMQIKESERGVGVYERMKRLAGMNDPKKEELIKRDTLLKELDKNPKLEIPVKKMPDLVDYYHWEIMRNRRRKGLSQKQLAEAINVSEISIEMLEKARLPDNTEGIIKKLENFFLIRLIKVNEIELINRMKKSYDKPVLLDEYGNVLDHIPEPKIESIINDEDFEKRAEKLMESHSFNEKGEFEIEKADLSKVRVGDLREIKKKIDVTKYERREEQKKIEEKQRVVEARKEEIRLLKEKETKELDNILGGRELLEPKG
ncbi:MAG: hypothetical protein Q8N99_01845 [Nanoarchaeota archaeon]|nr:hypothetical protein [Nanoarchaeota archaeon]